LTKFFDVVKKRWRYIELRRKILTIILAAIVIAAGMGGYLIFQNSRIQPVQMTPTTQPVQTTEIVQTTQTTTVQTTQTTQVTQTPQSIPKVGTVTIKAIDQNSKELVANVAVNKGGATVATGTTPLTLNLEYGTYTFTAVYQNLKNQKTVEINQPTQEIIFQFTTPSTQKSLVMLSSIDQNNLTLNAQVSIDGKNGITPLSILLDYGTYTLTATYKNLTVQKTVEINQPSQEIVVKFEIPVQPVFIETTSEQLFRAMHSVNAGEKKGENVTELKNWLLSLVGKTIRVKIEVVTIESRADSIVLVDFVKLKYDDGFIDWYFLEIQMSQSLYKKIYIYHEVITVDAVVDKVLFKPSNTFKMTFVSLIKRE
jgi:hypothetical protein